LNATEEPWLYEGDPVGVSRFEEMGKIPKQAAVFVEINPEILPHASARHSGGGVVTVHAGQEKMPPAARGNVAQGRTQLVCTVWLLCHFQ